MYQLTHEQQSRATAAAAQQTTTKLIELFKCREFSNAQKMDSAYKIIHADYPVLDTKDFLIQARILITSAKESAAAAELESAYITAIRKHFPNAVEIIESQK